MVRKGARVGEGLCRTCRAAMPQGGQFCSSACRQASLRLSSSEQFRDALLERDGGVCASCGIDCLAVEAEDRDRRSAAVDPGTTATWEDWRRARGFDGSKRTFWEVDHIVPVIDGGAAGLENCRTLCRPCHKSETSTELRARHMDVRSTETRIAPALASLATPIESLICDPHNARHHSAKSIEAIAASLARFGQRKPIVVQRRGEKLVIRAGNGQFEAARTMGWSHIAALVVDEDDESATAFAIADNRTAELSEWDKDLLADALQKLDDVDGIGYDRVEVDSIIGEIFASEPTIKVWDSSDLAIDAVFVVRSSIEYQAIIRDRLADLPVRFEERLAET